MNYIVLCLCGHKCDLDSMFSAGFMQDGRWINKYKVAQSFHHKTNLKRQVSQGDALLLDVDNRITKL
jgi:hypothetical protein